MHTQLGLNVSDAGVHKLMSSVKAYTVYDFGHYVCDVLSSKYRYGMTGSFARGGRKCRMASLPPHDPGPPSSLLG